MLVVEVEDSVFVIISFSENVLENVEIFVELGIFLLLLFFFHVQMLNVLGNNFFLCLIEMFIEESDVFKHISLTKELFHLQNALVSFHDVNLSWFLDNFLFLLLFFQK